MWKYPNGQLNNKLPKGRIVFNDAWHEINNLSIEQLNKLGYYEVIKEKPNKYYKASGWELIYEDNKYYYRPISTVFEIQRIKQDLYKKINDKRSEIAFSIYSTTTFCTSASSAAWNFDVDKISRDFMTGRLSDILSNVLPEEIIYWRDADDITREMTINQFKQLCNEIRVWTERIWYISWLKKEEVSNFNNEEALLNYDINAGWESVSYNN